MNYKNYTIEPDNTGYAPKSMTFGIYKDEEYIGSGETIEECKKMIDENILENLEWTDKSVIDFVNCSHRTKPMLYEEVFQQGK